MTSAGVAGFVSAVEGTVVLVLSFGATGFGVPPIKYDEELLSGVYGLRLLPPIVTFVILDFVGGILFSVV